MRRRHFSRRSGRPPYLLIGTAALAVALSGMGYHSRCYAAADPSAVTLPAVQEGQPSEGIEAETISPKKTAKLAFVGDILLAGTVGDLIKVEGPMAPWAGVKDVLSVADFAVGNLECAVGTTGEPAPGKTWTFRADPVVLEGLKEAGIDAVSLANNHTLDYGVECMLETVNRVRGAGIETVGAGINLADARKPVIREINGVKVGLLGTNMIYPDISWAAGDSAPGQAIDSSGWYPAILSDIRSLSQKVDVVAVYVHWSAERQEVPEKWVLPVAKAMREAGAHIIVGSHPHVLNGFDYDGRNLTAYSLGNFVFSTRPEMPKLQIGCVLEVAVSKDGVESAFVVPTRIVWGKTVLETGRERLDTLRRLSSLSGTWRTDVDDEGNIFPILFSDLGGHWARRTVTKLCLSGVIEGYPDGTFRPEAAISRGEFAALFSRAVAAREEIDNAPPPEGFSVCGEDSWAYRHLRYLAAKGLISPSDSNWEPSNPCARLDVLTVMKKHAELVLSPASSEAAPTQAHTGPAPASPQVPATPQAPTPTEPQASPQPPTSQHVPASPQVPGSRLALTSPDTSTSPQASPSRETPPSLPANLQPFTDVAGLDPESLATASWAVGVGLAKGYDDGSLRLNKTVTRGEMAELLSRYLRLTPDLTADQPD